MSLASAVYQPRSPEDGVLYRIVRDHRETFRAQAASLRDGEGLRSSSSEGSLDLAGGRTGAARNNPPPFLYLRLRPALRPQAGLVVRSR